MKFEYDPKKSRSNRLKHGISFHTAQQLWDGPYVEFTASPHYGEPRYALIAARHGKFYTCIFTYRGANIRIISCRRAREKERVLYEEE